MSLSSDTNIQYLWYTLRGESIAGPYPFKQVQRFIILGRINERDKLSTDRKNWKTLAELPELTPEVMGNPKDSDAEKKLIKARLKVDQRQLGDRRREEFPFSIERRRIERRKPESATILEYRKFKTEMLKDKQQHGQRKKIELTVVFSVIALIVALGLLLTLYSDQQTGNIANACNGRPGPGVDWTNCQLQGAQLQGQVLTQSRFRSANLSGANLAGAKLKDSDLSYADMSIANLKGANLTGASLVGAHLRKADLSDVDFSGANLSYANMLHANIDGASLINARLDHAIWVDSSICQPGSVGECVRLRQTVITSP